MAWEQGNGIFTSRSGRVYYYLLLCIPRRPRALGLEEAPHIESGIATTYASSSQFLNQIDLGVVEARVEAISKVRAVPMAVK